MKTIHEEGGFRIVEYTDQAGDIRHVIEELIDTEWKSTSLIIEEVLIEETVREDI